MSNKLKWIREIQCMVNKGYIIRSARDIYKSPLNVFTVAATVLIRENLNEN